MLSMPCFFFGEGGGGEEFNICQKISICKLSICFKQNGKIVQGVEIQSSQNNAPWYHLENRWEINGKHLSKSVEWFYNEFRQISKFLNGQAERFK